MNSNQILIIIGIIIITLLISLQPKQIKIDHQIEEQIEEPQIHLIKQQRQSIPNEPVTFEVVGIVYSKSETDDSIYELLGKRSQIQRNRYLYKIRDRDTGLLIPLNDGDPLPELYTDDVITILGKSGEFIVNIHKKTELYRRDIF